MSLLGLAMGIGIAALAATLRRRYWDHMVGFGRGLAWFLAIALGCILLFLAPGLFRSGDGGMYAMMALVLVVAVSAVLLIVPLLLGWLHAVRFGRPKRAAALAVVPEILLVVVTMYMAESWLQSRARAEGRAAYEAITQARQQERAVQEDVPEAYRGITADFLDQVAAQTRELAKQGIQRPPAVPPEVEAAIRRRDARAAEPPPAPPVEANWYGRLMEERNRFLKSTAVAWFLAALMIPLFLRQDVADDQESN